MSVYFNKNILRVVDYMLMHFDLTNIRLFIDIFRIWWSETKTITREHAKI